MKMTQADLKIGGDGSDLGGFDELLKSGFLTRVDADPFDHADAEQFFGIRVSLIGGQFEIISYLMSKFFEFRSNRNQRPAQACMNPTISR